MQYIKTNGRKVGEVVMKQYKVSVQSLIDHIKSAIDVDPWAKEMVEELLKEQQEEIENLKQTAQSMMEGVCLLKEQKETELCDRCGRRRLKSNRESR